MNTAILGGFSSELEKLAVPGVVGRLGRFLTESAGRTALLGAGAGAGLGAIHGAAQAEPGVGNARAALDAAPAALVLEKLQDRAAAPARDLEDVPRPPEPRVLSRAHYVSHDRHSFPFPRALTPAQ